jgi:EAL domain-containing protein (putative c-di-GMP-specific phosphodiesterase class I)
MKHVDATAATLRTLRESGLRVAIDDFGTGYSSLSYLRNLPIDTLKIDQSFVRQISAGSDDSALVTAMITMARSLRMQVVAEGVETRQELDFLRSQLCDDAQGYLFSKPVPASVFVSVLQANFTGGLFMAGNAAKPLPVPVPAI